MRSRTSFVSFVSDPSVYGLSQVGDGAVARRVHRCFFFFFVPPPARPVWGLSALQVSNGSWQNCAFSTFLL